MTNDNTRTKANAVFFSVLMVLSMVAVGFAAAPAAAAPYDSITFNDQQIDGNNVNVTLSGGTGVDDGDVGVVVTYGDDLTVAGSNTSVTTGPGNSVLVDIGSEFDTEGPGTYTAHLFNSSTGALNGSTGIQDNNPLTQTQAADVVDDDSAVVGENVLERTAGENIVYNGTTVYQGEDDLTFFPESQLEAISPGDLQKTAGDAEGTALNLPIAEDAATGTYADSDTGCRCCGR